MTKEWGPGQVTPRALGPLYPLPPSFSGLLQVVMVCLKPSSREAFIEHPLDITCAGRLRYGHCFLGVYKGQARKSPGNPNPLRASH